MNAEKLKKQEIIYYLNVKVIRNRDLWNELSGQNKEEKNKVPRKRKNAGMCYKFLEKVKKRKFERSKRESKDLFIKR